MARKKILIVEDNAESRTMLEQLLASKGHRIVAAENGEEALCLARQAPPDVIISDITMPVMNGFRLCREVKKDPGLRHVPFVFYTATFVEKTYEKLAMSLGASRFVVKPTEGEAFLQILDDVLKEYEQGILPVPEGQPEDQEFLLEIYESSITRKLAETVARLKDERKALIRSERWLKEAQELAHIGHWELDLKSNSLEWSDEIYRILGMQPQEFEASFKALLAMEMIHPEDRDRVTRAHKESLAKKRPCNIEYRLVFKDGTLKYVNERSQTLFDDQGGPTCFIGTVQDITARKQAEERLRFLSSAVEQSSEGMAMADMEGNLIYVNQAWAEMHGYKSPEALAGRHLSIFHDQVQLKNEVEPFNKMVVQNGYHKGEVGHIRKDGEPFSTLMTTTLIKDENGKPIALSSIAKDITGIKTAEVELKTERDTLRGLMDGLATTRIGVDIVDLNYRVLYQNKVLMEAFGDITGKLCYENYMGLDIPCDSCPMAVAIRSGKVERDEMTGSDGRHYEIFAAPLPSPEGTVDKAIEVVLDITERKEAEKALKEAYDIINRSSSVAFTWKNQEGWPVEFVSENVERLFGYTAEEFMTGEVDYAGCVHPDDLQRMANEVEEFSSRPETTEFVHEPYRIVAKDGSEKMINDWTCIARDKDGRITHYKGIVEDITERRRAEEEQNRLQTQLHQAQRMESIGILAGGVAHDFNNLLTTIIGNAQLALADLPKGNPTYEDIREILKAGERGAMLTRQLMTFSRREVPQPEVLDLNVMVNEMEKLLRRLVRESIELQTVAASGLWKVEADPGQMEQVIMNLVVNSRDVMMDGGTLTIETGNAKLDAAHFRAQGVAGIPGDYVMLAVTDTGPGMNAAIKERVFEPFFTTKERGAGTGLGLSTVYGIVKQNKGYIWPYSQPGKGTTMKVYLPRAEETLSAVSEKDISEKVVGAGEVVLVVEDEAPIRELTVRSLKMGGYEAVVAADGEEALRIIEGFKGEIHLLVTDVVMPRMGGQELAERIRVLRPGIKVLYISGFPGGSLPREVLESKSNLLRKPFTPETLCRKVRETLGAG